MRRFGATGTVCLPAAGRARHTARMMWGMMTGLRRSAVVFVACGLASMAQATGESGENNSSVGTVAEAADSDAALGSVRPRTRWEHRERHPRWNRGALQALRTHGRALVEMVPDDIAFWCPGYQVQDDERRRHFWVGFLSALAKYESTYKPDAVGGDGQWYGLLQILPGTAQSYDCRARSGDALKDGADNLSCALRIMAVTVPRDGVIQGKDDQWLGVSADWGPLRSKDKRKEMADWLKSQRYCRVPDRERAGVVQDSEAQ